MISPVIPFPLLQSLHIHDPPEARPRPPSNPPRLISSYDPNGSPAARSLVVPSAATTTSRGKVAQRRRQPAPELPRADKLDQLVLAAGVAAQDLGGHGHAHVGAEEVIVSDGEEEAIGGGGRMGSVISGGGHAVG